MPTYLIHGFRWPRPLIRIHIILQNLDDAAAEWLMAPSTSNTMIANFKTLYPDSMAALPNLRFLEQYDPADDSIKSQPFAYVADVVEEVRLGLDIDEVRGKGVGAEAWSALVELRDKIAPGEKVAWFIVVCGDTERWAPPTVGLLEGSNRAPSAYGSQSNASMSNFDAREADDRTIRSPTTKKEPSGLRKFFTKKEKTTKGARSNSNGQDASPPPPLANGFTPSPPMSHPTYSSDEAPHLSTPTYATGSPIGSLQRGDTAATNGSIQRESDFAAQKMPSSVGPNGVGLQNTPPKTPTMEISEPALHHSMAH